MPILSLASAAFAFLLVGAHFLRGGQFAFVAICVAAVALLWLRREWVPWVTQGLLALAALEWVHTIASIAAARTAEGRPALRMAIILGSVVAVTLVAALAQRSARARRWYAGSRGATGAEVRTAA